MEAKAILPNGYLLSRRLALSKDELFATVSEAIKHADVQLLLHNWIQDLAAHLRHNKSFRSLFKRAPEAIGDLVYTITTQCPRPDIHTLNADISVFDPVDLTAWYAVHLIEEVQDPSSGGDGSFFGRDAEGDEGRDWCHDVSVRLLLEIWQDLVRSCPLHGFFYVVLGEVQEDEGYWNLRGLMRPLRNKNSTTSCIHCQAMTRVDGEASVPKTKAKGEKLIRKGPGAHKRAVEQDGAIPSPTKSRESSSRAPTRIRDTLSRAAKSRRSSDTMSLSATDVSKETTTRNPAALTRAVSHISTNTDDESCSIDDTEIVGEDSESNSDDDADEIPARQILDSATIHMEPLVVDDEVKAQQDRIWDGMMKGKQERRKQWDEERERKLQKG